MQTKDYKNSGVKTTLRKKEFFFLQKYVKEKGIHQS